MSEENVLHENEKFTPTNRKIRNPFDKALIDRLHQPICSPGMCKIYKKKNNGSFRWDIDQACTLVPADIVACNSQFEPSPDPALERIAEEATELYFSQEMVMPSPHLSSKKIKPVQITENCLKTSSFNIKKSIVFKSVSVQTVFSLPPILPPEVEKVLQPYFTNNQEYDIFSEYEVTENGSLKRKLVFEEHSDVDRNYDSEQTDDETHIEQKPQSSYEMHTPVVFSPDLCHDPAAKGMRRTFGTPINKGAKSKSCYHNKILNAIEPTFSPINFHTPKRLEKAFISPVPILLSSDEEKNETSSPETEKIATCLKCVASDEKNVENTTCLCQTPSNKSILKRSVSLKESPPRNRKGSISFSEKRSLSMSSLQRSKSVQKLDFSLDMSIDGSVFDQSQAESQSSPQTLKKDAWSLVEETSIRHLLKHESTKTSSINLMDETPIKGKCKSSILTHEISKIRASLALSPGHMSLDSSIDSNDNPLSLEHKKIDFNTVDLKYLTENSRFDFTTTKDKPGSDSTCSFKRIDSGFNENNTFYTNASSYYESAIKPSELTITNNSKCTSKSALKDTCNMNWMRVDSGFKDENSSDGLQFFTSSNKSPEANFDFSQTKLVDKENFERFLGHGSPKNEAMSLSEIFTDDMTFNCNFSSTPSKNKPRNT